MRWEGVPQDVLVAGIHLDHQDHGVSGVWKDDTDQSLHEHIELGHDFSLSARGALNKTGSVRRVPGFDGEGTAVQAGGGRVGKPARDADESKLAADDARFASAASGVLP